MTMSARRYEKKRALIGFIFLMTICAISAGFQRQYDAGLGHAMPMVFFFVLNDA
jgi:hypothetical protein